MTDTTQRPGRKHADCQFIGHLDKLEDYWQRNLRQLDDRLEEHRRQTLDLFQKLSVQVQVNKDITEHLRDRVDEGFRELATQIAGRELEMRRWLEVRLCSSDSRDAMQDALIQEVAAGAGKRAGMKTSSVVASLVVGFAWAVQQLAQLLH